jgi:aspartate aminotransferase
MQIRFTDRLNRIQLSQTGAVLAAAERLKAEGVDLVDFGPGEPDFATPEHIQKAAIQAIHENRTKYTPTGGIAPLREAIPAWHRRELGSNYSAKECVATVGGKHAIFNVMCSLIQQGDEVILPAPYWVSFLDIIKYAGGTPVVVKIGAEHGFAPTAAAIEAAITPKTRIAVVNSPSNPAGGVVSPEEFGRILDLCKRRGIWLMADECYSHFVYEPNKPFSIASVAGSKDNVIVIGSVSKTFAMTGWRIGYVLAPESLVNAVIKIQSQSTGNPSSIAQYAALEAMRGTMDTVPQMLAEYTKRRKRVIDGLRAIPGLSCEWPGGAFYAFPNVSAYLGNGPKALAATCTDLSRLLLDKARVAVVPGEAFGAPGHLRLSYATSLDRIEEGLRRLEKFFTRAEAAS